MNSRLSILMVIAVAMLAACTKSVTGPKVPEEMVFSAVASHSVKNIITTTNYPLDEPFMVEAVHYPNGDIDSDGTIFITEEQVEYKFDETLWRTKGDYFWPEKGKILFYAGSPIIPQVSITPDRGVEADWSIKTMDETQTDLCFARVVETCESHPSVVPIVFAHALSQICIKARTHKEYSSSYTDGDLVQANVISIILDSVKIGGIIAEGRFFQKPREWEVNPSVTADYVVFKSEEGLELKCDRYDNPELELIKTMLLIPQTLPEDAVLEEWHHAVVRSSVTNKKTGEIVSDNTYIVPRSAVIPIYKHCERWIMDFKYTLRLAVGIDDDASTLAVAVTDWTETKEIILGDE